MRSAVRRVIGAIVIGAIAFGLVAMFSAPASAGWCSDKQPEQGFGCTD